MNTLRLSILAGLTAAAAPTAFAQLSLDWSTIDGGSGVTSGGAFTLAATVGQPDPGPAMSAGPFSVEGGFWIAFASTPPACGIADFDCDGDTGTDADIEAFFRCIAGTCPPPPCTSTADFNFDGDSATDADIEAFFRVLAGGSC
jgi:hypothetical protein